MSFVYYSSNGVNVKRTTIITKRGVRVNIFRNEFAGFRQRGRVAPWLGGARHDRRQRLLRQPPHEADPMDAPEDRQEENRLGRPALRLGTLRGQGHGESRLRRPRKPQDHLHGPQARVRDRREGTRQRLQAEVRRVEHGFAGPTREGPERKDGRHNGGQLGHRLRDGPLFGQARVHGGVCVPQRGRGRRSDRKNRAREKGRGGEVRRHPAGPDFAEERREFRERHEDQVQVPRHSGVERRGLRIGPLENRGRIRDYVSGEPPVAFFAGVAAEAPAARRLQGHHRLLGIAQVCQHHAGKHIGDLPFARLREQILGHDGLQQLQALQRALRPPAGEALAAPVHLRVQPAPRQLDLDESISKLVAVQAVLRSSAALHEVPAAGGFHHGVLRDGPRVIRRYGRVLQQLLSLRGE